MRQSHNRKFEQLLERIRANEESLKKVYLDSKWIEDDGVCRLAEALRGNTVVTHLFLWNNNISDVGARALAEMLRINSTITELKLGWNYIGVAGGRVLAEMLRSNSTITKIDLSYNSTGDDSAKALADVLQNNNTITDLNLGHNKMDSDLRAKVKLLVKINKESISPEEAHQRKADKFGVSNNPTKSGSLEEACRRESAEFGPAEKPSKFYAKLVEEDERNINLKITELVPLVEDAHDAVLFYTLVNFAYRSGGIAWEDRSRYVRDGLRAASTTTACTKSIALFKLLLDKALEDGAITGMERNELDREAEVTHTSQAPFVQELREHIKSNTARIHGLEANAEALGRSVDRLKAGIRHQWRVEAATGLIGAVLNAVSFGAAGSVLSAGVKATISSIVDFGDVSHIQAVVTSVGDKTVKDAFAGGLALAEDGFADQKLYEAARDGNPIVTIAFAAKVIVEGSRPHNGGVHTKKKPSAPLEARLKFLEEKLQPGEVKTSVLGRVSSLEELIFGFVRKGALLERVTNLEEELGVGQDCRLKVVSWQQVWITLLLLFVCRLIYLQM